MNTFTYIIIYFVICAMVALLIPVTRNKWKEIFGEFKDGYNRTKDWADNQGEQTILPLFFTRSIYKFLVVFIFIILTVLFIIFIPFLLPFLVIYYQKKYSKWHYYKMNNNKWEYYEKMCPANGKYGEDISNLYEYEEESNENNYLYFSNGKSGFKNHIPYGVGITINCLTCGHKEEFLELYCRYYQCQSCGMLYGLSGEERRNKKECDCGGILEGDKPIFCPNCKSKNLEYEDDGCIYD